MNLETEVTTIDYRNTGNWYKMTGKKKYLSIKCRITVDVRNPHFGFYFVDLKFLNFTFIVSSYQN